MLHVPVAGSNRHAISHQRAHGSNTGHSPGRNAALNGQEWTPNQIDPLPAKQAKRMRKFRYPFASFVCSASTRFVSLSEGSRTLRKLFGAPFFFLSPRRRSGERTEERGIQGPSSPRPSPPFDGGEGGFLVSALSRWVPSRFDLPVNAGRHTK